MTNALSERVRKLNIQGFGLGFAALLIGITAVCYSERAHSMSVPRESESTPPPGSTTQTQARAQALNGLHCEIRSMTESGLLTLQGVVWAPEQMTGSYSFNVMKLGARGSSSTAQRGLFALSPNQEKIVSSVTVNVPAGDTYAARLLVKSDGIQLVCNFSLE